MKFTPEQLAELSWKINEKRGYRVDTHEGLSPSLHFNGEYVGYGYSENLAMKCAPQIATNREAAFDALLEWVAIDEEQRYATMITGEKFAIILADGRHNVGCSSNESIPLAITLALCEALGIDIPEGEKE